MKLKQNPKERVLDGLAFVIIGLAQTFAILVRIAIMCAGFGLIAYIYTASQFGRNTVIFVLLTTIALGSVVLLAEAYFWSLDRVAKREAAVQEGATDDA